MGIRTIRYLVSSRSKLVTMQDKGLIIPEKKDLIAEGLMFAFKKDVEVEIVTLDSSDEDEQ